MRSAWDTAQEVKFKPLENNLYTVQFSCLGDWERVMNDGPWNFRGDAVLIRPYDGITPPSTIKLETIDIWIQIHDVPDLYAHLVTPLAAKVGEILFSEPPSNDFVGNFYRVWVRLNVLKPLKNAVTMVRDGKRQIYRVKYERLPDWCAVCGMLGHQFKEHGSGIHPPSALVFKDLRASWFMRSGRGPGEGRGRRGGRRGGRSGSRPDPHEKDAYSRSDGTNMRGSGGDVPPEAAVTDVDMDEASRKRLAGKELGANHKQLLNTYDGRKVDDQLAIVPVTSPPIVREQKRTKKGLEQVDASNSAVRNLAGSFEERR
ncbi:hypothetical protein ACQJBY_043123 [Aegilops geniculata]